MKTALNVLRYPFSRKQHSIAIATYRLSAFVFWHRRRETRTDQTNISIWLDSTRSEKIVVFFSLWFGWSDPLKTCLVFTEEESSVIQWRISRRAAERSHVSCRPVGQSAVRFMIHVYQICAESTKCFLSAVVKLRKFITSTIYYCNTSNTVTNTAFGM